MSVTLQIKLNGGAPQTGGVTGAIGDVVQLTAANKSTWSGAARWEVYDYPPSFTVPAGWTADGDGVFYALGNADPPAFTISDAGDWGKFGCRVTATDGGILTTDEATALSIPSAGGLKSIMAGESSQFGGTREAWVKDLKADIRTLSAGSGIVAPTADTVPKRDAAGELYATSFKGGATGSTTVEATGGSSDATVKAGRNVILDHGSSGAVAIKNDGDTGGFLAALAIGECALAFDSNGTSSGFYVEETSTTIRADTKALTCEEVASVFTMTGDTGLALRAGGPITVQPAQATSGAGHALTIGGGPGQTSGTHAPGNVVIDQGTMVAGASAKVSLLASATEHMALARTTANGGGPTITMTGTGTVFSTASLFVGSSGSSLVLNPLTFVEARSDILITGPSAQAVALLQRGRLTTTAPGPQNVYTYNIPSNLGGGFIAEICVTNSTTKETSFFVVRFVAQNSAGVGSDAGAAVDVVPAIAEAGLTATIDRSGVTVRVRIDAPDTDSRDARCLLTFYPSSLV